MEQLLNPKVETYVRSRLKEVEQERQMLAVLRDNYRKHVKRELGMLLHAYGLEDKVLYYERLDLIGKLTVVENPELLYVQGSDFPLVEKLPFLIALEALPDTRGEDFSCPFCPAEGETELLKYFQEKVLPCVAELKRGSR